MRTKLARTEKEQNIAGVQATPATNHARAQPQSMTATLLNLQRTRGNRHVERLLSTKTINQGCACGSTSAQTGECEECRKKTLERRNMAGGETTTSSPGDRETNTTQRSRESFLGNYTGRGRAASNNPFRGPLTTDTLEETPEGTETLSVGSRSPLSIDGSPASTSTLDGGTTTVDGCVITGAFSTIPSGTLAATLSGTKLGASFQMIGDFDVPIPCVCSMGEYRQRVRGTFTKNGTNVTHALCGTNLHPTTFQEDCGIFGGKTYKYGYRSIPFANSKFTPDQATGCRFEGFDFPGISGATGDKLAINLDFEGELIDTRSGASLASSSWSVQGSATVP